MDHTQKKPEKVGMRWACYCGTILKWSYKPNLGILFVCDSCGNSFLRKKASDWIRDKEISLIAEAFSRLQFD